MYKDTGFLGLKTEIDYKVTVNLKGDEEYRPRGSTLKLVSPFPFNNTDIGNFEYECSYGEFNSVTIHPLTKRVSLSEMNLIAEGRLYR